MNEARAILRVDIFVESPEQGERFSDALKPLDAVSALPLDATAVEIASVIERLLLAALPKPALGDERSRGYVGRCRTALRLCAESFHWARF